MVKGLNNSLAFFVNDCLSLMDRSYVFTLIKQYCKAVRTVTLYTLAMYPLVYRYHHLHNLQRNCSVVSDFIKNRVTS